MRLIAGVRTPLSSVWPTEMLVDQAALRRWLAGTFPGVVFDPAIVDDALLRDLLALREAVYALVRASIGGLSWDREALELVNRWAAEPRLEHRLNADQRVQCAAGAPAQFLAELAVDAIDVLGADRGRLKLCEGPSCALPFLDESRGGSRRWCTAQRCGNRVNTKAYRNRSKG